MFAGKIIGTLNSEQTLLTVRCNTEQRGIRLYDPRDPEQHLEASQTFPR